MAAAHRDNLTNAAADLRVESALLKRVLSLHPTHATAAELIRDLAGEDADFAARDEIERAIRELTGAGVLHRSGDGLLVPTYAAVVADRLLAR